MTEKWKVPPELAAYAEYTNYPDRAEELINSDATASSNIIVAGMSLETSAQWTLLARLRAAGLLLHQDDTYVLCGECKRLMERGCPACGACEGGCHDGFKDNPCTHTRATWKAQA